MNDRRFSLEQDFMNFKIDDLLYGYLRSISTARPTGKKTANGKDEYEEYLPYKEYLKNKKLIADICGCSVKTVERHFNILFEAGLLDEVYRKLPDDEEQRIILFPIKQTSLFKHIEKDMLRYLLDTRNAQCIKVYIYLLNKYEWKSNYTFTLVELQEALGYSRTTKTATETMKNIIESFAREGIIEYEEDYTIIEKHGEMTKIPVKVLEFVAKRKEQLPKVW